MRPLVLQAAMAMMKGAEVVGVLVGTGALRLRGFAVEAPDVDFLVNGPVLPREESGYGGNPDVIIDGVKVQFIAVRDGGYREFFHPERADYIDGVLVAALEDVIGLKRWRGREKDREFLRGWDAWANRQEAAK